MKTALLQLSSSDDPRRNLATVREMLREAARQGAGFALTPEVTNCVSGSKTHQQSVFALERDDPTLAGLREEAAGLGLWLLIGSLGLLSGDADGRFANRSFLIGPEGGIVARYDKIHMFDVQVSETETYRESSNYRPGNRAVLAEAPFARIGMTICYDLRFPQLYRALAQAGAEVLTVPSAFSPATGVAHWEPLLRARAIESGAYVLAPAQCGKHEVRQGRPRATWGHALAVSPWGEVLCDLGTAPGIGYVTLDRGEVASARARIPSLSHDRPYRGPA